MKIIKHFSLGVDSFAAYDKKIQPNRIARPILLLTTLGKKVFHVENLDQLSDSVSRYVYFWIRDFKSLNSSQSVLPVSAPRALMYESPPRVK